MNKAHAIKLLGGTNAAAGERIGITAQAVSQWPDPLPPAIADRVVAALARKHLPPELIGAEVAGAPALPTAEQGA